jgi:H+/Na+-translocating ferredoxin:NAD+ oxidoreductase subunit C
LAPTTTATRTADGCELMAMRLRPLQGGLVLAAHKAASTAHPALIAPLPAQLRLALIQNGGTQATPVVSAGEQVMGGALIASAPDCGIPVLAPTSGRILGIEEHPLAHPSGISGPCIVLETDGEGRCTTLPPLHHETDPDEIVARACAAGIPGLGGAGFPTWRKLGSGRGAHTHTVILNGAECEPYISCDDMLMREAAHRVIEGALLIHRAVGAERLIIAIEDDKPEAIAAMRRAAPDEAMVVVLPTLYPEGGERQLIQVLTGLEVPAGSIPADIGVLCQNVATASALADAVLRGQTMSSRMVTVTGDAVARPTNMVAHIGTPIRELIEAAGGYRAQPDRLLIGGPLMGFTLTSDDTATTPATNCIIAAAPEELAHRTAERACIRCGDCVAVCPAGLLPQQLHWAIRARTLDDAERLHVSACIECGCCDLVCPSHIALTEEFRFAKQALTLQRTEREHADTARRRYEFREARLARQAQQRTQRLAAKRAARGIGGAKATPSPRPQAPSQKTDQEDQT